MNIAFQSTGSSLLTSSSSSSLLPLQPNSIPTTVEQMAAGTEPDVVEVPTPPESCSSPPQTYPGCYGLPYQDHNYGAPPPLSPVPKITSCPIEIDTIETTVESTAVISNDVTVSTTVGKEDSQTNNDVDDSITRCICNFQHDDGYMICCDICSVWQHIDCMGIERNNIPESYCCEVCDPRAVDKKRAIGIQTKKRQEMTDVSSSDEDDKNTTYTASTGKTPTSIKLKQNHKDKEKKRKRRDSDKNDRKQKIRKSKDGHSESNNNKKTKKDGAKKSCNRSSKRLPSSVLENENAQDPWESSMTPEPHTYEEAKTNQYSPEIEAVLALNRLNGAHSMEPSLSDQLQVQLCKLAVVHDDRKGLVATDILLADQPVIEYKGNFMQRDQFDTKMFFKRVHPYVLFYSNCDHMNICVDATSFGNDARFIRRSCVPNAEVRHIVDSGSMNLCVYSVKEIPLGTEVTIPFDFNYRDCDYCVECACNRTNCSVSKYYRKKAKAKENDVPARKTRTKSKDEYVDVEEDIGKQFVAEPVAKKKKLSPLKISVPTCTASDVLHSPNQPEESGKTPKSAATPKTPTSAPYEHGEEHLDADEKKLSREERKMLAIMKAFEKLEKREERRKDALERLAHKKEVDDHQHHSDEGSNHAHETAEVMSDEASQQSEKTKQAHLKKKGKGKGHSTPARRRSRFNSGSSRDAPVSADEDSNHAPSSQTSAPSTPLPLDPLTPQPGKAVRFPKTKKHLMNEWLIEKGFDTPKPLSIKTDLTEEPADSAEFVKCIPSPHNSWSHLRRDSNTHPQVAMARQTSLESSMGSSIKKRWLHQAMKENTSTLPDSGNNSPIHNGSASPSMPSPSGSPPPDFVTPLKKRRLARESMSSQDGLLTPAQTPSTPIFNLEHPELSVKTLLEPGKNGVKPYSPITPLTPGDNLFEKFKDVEMADHNKVDLQKMESVESNVSESMLTGDPGITDMFTLKVTGACDIKTEPLETIPEVHCAEKTVDRENYKMDQPSSVKLETDISGIPGKVIKLELTTKAEEILQNKESAGKLVEDRIGLNVEPMDTVGCKNETEDVTCKLDCNTSDVNSTGIIKADLQETNLRVDNSNALNIKQHVVTEAPNITSEKLRSNLIERENTDISGDFSSSSSVQSTIPFGPIGVKLKDKLASLACVDTIPSLSLSSAVSVDPKSSTDGTQQQRFFDSSFGLNSISVSPDTSVCVTPDKGACLTGSQSDTALHLSSKSEVKGLTLDVSSTIADHLQTTSAPTTPMPETPPIKKKVSLSEYRSRMKHKTSTGNTPIKTPSVSSPPPGLLSPSPGPVPPSLPSLPLFTKTHLNDQDKNKNVKKDESDVRWSQREKPLSLMERLKKEFGVDAEEEKTENKNNASSNDNPAYQTNIVSPTAPAAPQQIPSLMSLPNYQQPSYKYQGVPQPVPPPPPPQKFAFPYADNHQEQKLVSKPLPLLTNGIYGNQGQQTSPHGLVRNGPSLSQNGLGQNGSQGGAPFHCSNGKKLGYHNR